VGTPRSTTAPAGEGDEQTAIIESYLAASVDDRLIAQSLAEQARGLSDRTDLGPLVKLWCEAAAIAPDPENLLECGRSRLGAVDQMSNPQPNREAVRIGQARDALVMVRAALEIAGGDPNVSDALRARLRDQGALLRKLVADADTNDRCSPRT